MTVKTLKKQLAAAIAMVLVSVIALSSSTYAWFAANTQVSATGMQVQAQTEGGIEIAYAESTGVSGTFSTSANAGATSAIPLAPTSTVNTSAWYHASAETSGASAARVRSYETLSISESAIANQAYGKTGGVTVGTSTTNYYMVQNFNIRSTSAASLAKGLKVQKVEVAGNSANMSKALRVAIKMGDTVLIYDPIGNDTTQYSIYSGYTVSGGTATATEAGRISCKAGTTEALLAESADTEIPAKGTSANGGVDVKVYIYYDGEDSELYSDNFATEGLTVTVTFTATAS